MYALKLNIINYARDTPSSDHNEYNSCTWDLGQMFCSLRSYVDGESRTFIPESGALIICIEPILAPYTDGCVEG